MIQFCNSLKKGALYILGHVIVTEDFAGALPEARRQQAAWTRYIDYFNIKAFVNIAISPAVEWGARNIVLSAGLGGMRPNIAVLALYNLDELKRSEPLVDVGDELPVNDGKSPRPSFKLSDLDFHHDSFQGQLPTDTCRTESRMSPVAYLTLLEDLLLRLQINVAVAKGFQSLELPDKDGHKNKSGKKYIDLWPIQMSAEIASEGDDKPNVLTTNFDTYTLILQLGCILNTVRSWKSNYRLRVAVFVEYESDVEEESIRVKKLLEDLRIEAEVMVFWLACGELSTYEVIVNGKEPAEPNEEIHKALGDEEWWQEMRKLRAGHGSKKTGLKDVAELVSGGLAWPSSVFQQGPRDDRLERFEILKKLMQRKPKRKHTQSGLHRLGVSLGMRTNRLHPAVANKHIGSASEDSDTTDSETSYGEESESDTASAASEGDLDDFEVEEENEVTPLRPNTPSRMRRASHGDSLRGPGAGKKGSLRHAAHFGSSSGSSKAIPDYKLRRSETQTPADTTTEPALAQPKPERPPTSSSQIEISAAARPALPHRSSTPKFSSKPVPATKVASGDGPGPSIMFAHSPPRGMSEEDVRGRNKAASDAFTKTPEEGRSGASGYPHQPSTLPLSFNELPSRAQHLILNQLIRTHSNAETAVILTTLPSPLEGTSRDEKDCLRYLADLEVLCKDLPPCLLVHSNSLTVTTNL